MFYHVFLSSNTEESKIFKNTPYYFCIFLNFFHSLASIKVGDLVIGAFDICQLSDNSIYHI